MESTKMERIKTLAVFLIFCIISSSWGNFTTDSGDHVRFAREVSLDPLASITELGVFREDVVNPKPEPRNKRDTESKKCISLKATAFTNFKSVMDSTKEFRFVPPMTCKTAKLETRVCTTAVRLIDCGASYFKNATKTTFSNVEIPLQVMEKFFQANMDFANKASALLDKIENQGSGDTECCKIEDIKTPLLQETEDTLLKNTESYIQNAKAKYCGWQISKKRSRDALSTLEKFKPDITLRTVLEEAYKFHQGEKVPEILQFIKELPTCPDKASAYASFIEVLKDSNYATSFETLRVWNSYNSSGCSEEAMNSVNMSSLLAWSFGKDVRLRGRNVAGIYNFLNSNNVASDYIPSIVKIAYNGNVRNVPNILEFIKGLSKKEEDLKACTFLFEEIHKTMGGFNGHEIIMVVNRIYEDRQYVSEAEIHDMVKVKQIEDAVPVGIQTLLMKPKISIQNKLFPNITIGLREKDTEYAMACPSETHEDFNNTWAVDVLDQGRYFKFTNVYNMSLALSSRSSKISASEGDSYWHQWQVTPVQNGEYFYLANRATGQIIEAQSIQKRGFFKNCTYIYGVRGTRWQRGQKYWRFNEAM